MVKLSKMAKINNFFTRRRASKAFYRSIKTTFLAYFHVFPGNHQRVYYQNTVNPKKDIIGSGLN